MDIVFERKKLGSAEIIVCLMILLSSTINYSVLGFELWDSLAISIAYTMSIVFGSMYVVKTSKLNKLAVNIGGFVAPLIYSLSTLFIIHVATCIEVYKTIILLIVLSIIFYYTSIHIVGYGIGLSVIPTSLLISSSTIIVFHNIGNPLVCIPLSSSIGYLSIIIGVDVIKTIHVSLKRKIEFILGGAGVSDIVVITGSLTPIITLLLIEITFML
ncbi:DUF1614 domain-containing protein [Desulfurococcaceae archaeon MEX13E-LK6-19]|nr:DUF1614 domain-containing protein [Desulfurococcaceae archaeon MEX13E-LK6-19]